MNVDHAYCARAIEKLVKAIEEKAAQLRYVLQPYITQANSLAEKIQQDASATTHANSIRQATDIISKALQNIQQKYFSALKTEAQHLREAAGSIDPDKLTLNQQERIKNFFRQAADLLNKMNS